MKFQSVLKSSLLLLVLLFIFFGCAKIESPSGGPEDKTPPEIISVYPSTGSIDVLLETDIELVFSKSMNQSITEKALFISPLFFDYPEYKWSGKKLKIKLPEKLRPNTTYVLTVGSSAADKRGNKLGESVSYPFSTGKSIYACSISGRVMSDNIKSLSVWAYKLESEQPDSFWMILPDYVTEPDSAGDFKFEYLSPGNYLVVAVEDKNKDQFWAPPGEKMALPDNLVILDVDNQQYGPLIMMTVPRDTLKAEISRASSLHNKNITVEFSRAMDTVSVLSADNFRIHPVGDSLALIAIDNIYPVSNDFRAVNIECSGLIEGNKYTLNAVGLKTAFDIVSDTLYRIFEAAGIDSLSPDIEKIIPEPTRSPIPSGFDIIIWFSEAMDTSELTQNISITDSSDILVQFSSEWKYPNNLIIKPEFQADNVYFVSFVEQNIFDKTGNPLGDTIRSYRYYIASPDTFGQVIGTVINSPEDKIIVVAQPKKGEVQFVKCDDEGQFICNRLFPGTYYLRAFSDFNNNGIFDGGGIRPFRFAEPIALYADTVMVRSRWETDIGVLDFKKSSK